MRATISSENPTVGFYCALLCGCAIHYAMGIGYRACGVDGDAALA